MRYVIAHDLGTSGNKATLYDENGVLVASNLASYKTATGPGGVAEQDARAWWKAVCESTLAMLEASKASPADIAAVTFSGQMMGCLPVDAAGEPLRASIIWADMRAEKQAADLAAAVPRKDFYRIAGHRPSSSYSLAKLMWIRDNEAQVFGKTAKVLQAKDFIVHKLTGVFATDYSDASGTNAFDLVGKKWSAPILDAVGIPVSLFPDAHPSTAVVGTVSAEAARATGLRQGTPVVIGGGDGSCAAVGAGVVKEGKAYNVLGSSSWAAVATDQPIFDPEERTFNWVHLDPAKYSPCGTMQAAGYSLSWLKGALAGKERYLQETQGADAYALIDEAVKTSPAGAGNLLFLPYILGERSPRWDPAAKGCFVGLTVNHGAADVYRSVFEGVAFNLRTIISIVSSLSPIDEVILIGGGAKSAVWRRILCDVWGKRVLVPKYLDEATSMGAAVAGGVGVGLFPDFSVAERFNPIVEAADPDAAAMKRYDALYPIFEQAYASLKPVFQALDKA